MKKFIPIGIIAATIGLSACGGTTTTTTKTVPPAAPAPDVNQQIADSYIKADPADVAFLCHYSQAYPGAYAKQVANILGPQIIARGGDVSAVTADLLAHC